MNLDFWELCGSPTPSACKEKLCLAAKARIRRMVSETRHRTDLAVPEWVKQEWERGTEAKDRMAETLQNVNWSKAGTTTHPGPISSPHKFHVTMFDEQCSLKKYVLISHDFTHEGCFSGRNGEDHNPQKDCEGHQG